MRVKVNIATVEYMDVPDEFYGANDNRNASNEQRLKACHLMDYVSKKLRSEGIYYTSIAGVIGDEDIETWVDGEINFGD